MATAVAVPVKNVTSPHHLAAFPFLDRTGNDRVRMEVYTGWVVVHHKGGGAPVHRTTYATYVPLDGNVVQAYQQNDLLAATVTAAPSSVADDDDEANVAAVDSASVKLEPQAFPGVGGTKYCLVLRATVAAEQAEVIAFTYQVTVLTKLGDRDPDPIKLDGDDAPQ